MLRAGVPCCVEEILSENVDEINDRLLGLGCWGPFFPSNFENEFRTVFSILACRVASKKKRGFTFARPKHSSSMSCLPVCERRDLQKRFGF